MKSIPRLLRHSAALGVALLVLASASAQPAPTPTPVSNTDSTDDARLIISNGLVAVPGGKPVRATLRNVIDVVHRRYPETNITLVGVDDVMVENLQLEWRKTSREPGDIQRDPPLVGVLAAIAAAANSPVAVQDFELKNFLLRRVEPQNDTARRVEVFNLSRLLGVSSAASLEEGLQFLTQQRDRLKEKYADKHPQVVDIEKRIEELQRQLASAAQPGKTNVNELLAQITQVVQDTLRTLNPDEKPPEFKFHPGSNVLVVIGSEQAVDVTRKVLAALDR
jgi:hypothetical protein